jgi:hypothetical protein
MRTLALQSVNCTKSLCSSISRITSHQAGAGFNSHSWWEQVAEDSGLSVSRVRLLRTGPSYPFYPKWRLRGKHIGEKSRKHVDKTNCEPESTHRHPHSRRSLSHTPLDPNTGTELRIRVNEVAISSLRYLTHASTEPFVPTRSFGANGLSVQPSMSFEWTTVLIASEVGRENDE